ncbi:hypothetical protein E1A91_D01G035000v1 [Gossypium mustelinum]|uniref:non-specific serine/threonine protein kinase n=1 Tax=Gossypium mustelinum TaxID=34275 RepID=A0A5D2W4M0_GOSMU|nr:hypothetical protein E1A91_D01G035000v1 [Gossypium mustelinum]
MGKTITCSVLLALISYFYLLFATALDTITPSKSIKDPDVIISQNGVFRLGFFSLANSNNRYVGILYHQIPVQTVVWVANRNRPLKDSSGILTISDDGNLVVSNGKAEILWSTNVTNLVPNATSAQLLDSRNLVLNNGENGGSSILWESFQHPSNVFLQTMKISTDVKTGRKVQTRSWKSPDDPSDGNFFQGIEPFSIPEGVIWNNNQIYFRTGPWNGRIYIVLINVNRVYFDGFYVVADDSDGRYVERIWDAGKGDWINGCLKGFKPRNIEEWSRGNWSSGCQGDDGFFKLKKMKVATFPDQSSITNGECKDQCMKNCSCVAYAYDAGIGCMLWSGDLIDVQKFSNRGVDLYIRLPSSELDKGNSEIIVITTVNSGMVVIIIIAALFLLRRMGQYLNLGVVILFLCLNFVIDPIKQKLLDWRKRFNIIEGISRGLLYLYRDSRLKIIHRDLKTSNVLLDQELNLKISDFGIARIFGVQTCLITNNQVWDLWNEGNIWDLVDKVISKSESDLKNKKEIWRCIHVGLLCVQEYAKDRPTMSTIVLMLNSEISDLNTPKQPAFTQALLINDDFVNCVSFNDVTLTGFDGR